MSYNYKLENPQFFAPVVIPTLCRYDHFKQCLESLMKCTWADKTDVYIGLDYPAKDSHWDGYKKICSYLKEIEESHGFKSLNVIKREHNFGFGPKGNFATLRDYVFSFSDRLIASEDDNIFSPAFLDYINKGLELFKDDPSVLAINGYRHFYDVKFDDNTFYRQNVDFSAWGYGIWKDKYEAAYVATKVEYWRKISKSLQNWRKIWNNGLNRVLDFIHSLSHDNALTDNQLSIYMAVNKCDVIMPKISMVRNIGWDGSGEHCNSYEKSSDKYSQQIIYQDTLFNYNGSGKSFYAENHKIYVTNSVAKINFLKLIFTVTNETLGKFKRMISHKIVS